MKTRKLYDCFERATRTNGDEFVKLKDDAPEWLLDAVCECHSGAFPEDWIYETCRAVCGAIDDGEISEEDSDGLHSFVDAQVEIYTKEIFQWAANFCQTSMFSDAESEAKLRRGAALKEDNGLAESGTIVEKLQVIQYCAIQAIAAKMLEAVSDSSEEEEDDAAE